MPIVLIITMCLASDPATCRDENLLLAELTPIACLIQGERIAADYLEDFPKWRLRGWKCRTGQPGHPA